MKPLVTDELWALVEPMLPKRRTQPQGGRPWVDDRVVLTGILFVLRSGIPWRMLPPEMRCGSGVTCWHRLRDWQCRGVWERLHRVMLERLAQPARSTGRGRPPTRGACPRQRSAPSAGT